MSLNKPLVSIAVVTNASKEGADQLASATEELARKYDVKTKELLSFHVHMVLLKEWMLVLLWVVMGHCWE